MTRAGGSSAPGRPRALCPLLSHPRTLESQRPLQPAGPVQEVSRAGGSRKILGSRKGGSGKEVVAGKFLVVPVRPSFG